MSEGENSEFTYRAEIAQRNRLRQAEDRERKLSMAIVGLTAYSAFANLMGGVAAISASPIDAGLGLILGALYAFAAYRVWLKDDVRWWPVALPAGISIAVLVLAWFGGLPRPIPIVLNIALLALVPIRARAAARLAAAGAAPNNSSKPTPLRVAA